MSMEGAGTLPSDYISLVIATSSPLVLVRRAQHMEGSIIVENHI